MPGRLISHNFLIVGSSQVQQMLLLPPLLNKVGREERHLSIVFFHWNQNKHCVYAVLSNRKPCAKSSFCVTQKTDKNLPLYFYHYANDLPPTPILLRIHYSYSHSDMLTWISFISCSCKHLILNMASSGVLLFLSHTHTASSS